MNRFTLRQLQYLVACVDCRSVSEAAAQLNVSQPTISVAITKLEEQLGVQLLLRHHSRGVTATAVAENMLPSARSLLAHASDLERQTIEAGTNLAGELRLGSLSTLAPAVLPGLIRELSHAHPGIKLHLREGSQDKVIKWLYDGQLDLALLYDIKLPKDIRALTLAERAPYVALSADHPLAAQSDVALTELVHQPLILLDMEPSRDYFLGLFRDVGLDPRIAHALPSIELVRGLVGRGLGYSLLVTRPTSDMTYDGQPLAIRPLRDDTRTSRIVLVSLADLRPTRLMQRFEEMAAEVVPMQVQAPR